MTDITADKAPLLVLAAGQRCGSTLVQRLLCSHPSVRIWGEHAGALRQVLTVVQRLRLWSDSSGMAGRRELESSDYDGFIANLTPQRSQIDKACVDFIETLFAAPARDEGRPVWGFKEVRYGLPDVLLLRDLFPQLRVVLVVRDPRDVLRSLDEWENLGGWNRVKTEESLRSWHHVAGSFVGADTDPHLCSFIQRVRYEDLVHFSPAWVPAIAEHCGLEADRLDAKVFERRVHTVGTRGRTERRLREWSELPASLRALVDDEDLRMVASTYGYDFGTT
ncbi:sulfotransferase [Mycobacterium sp. NPDC051804]|uniref:sulfotransferase n=1 Tax=Mycobacterium sp. NPDC051804 TaxID=3364295 RepID=UPI00379EC927